VHTVNPYPWTLGIEREYCHPAAYNKLALSHAFLVFQHGAKGSWFAYGMGALMFRCMIMTGQQTTSGLPEAAAALQLPRRQQCIHR
jgi:hypothetical protein